MSVGLRAACVSVAAAIAAIFGVSSETNADGAYSPPPPPVALTPTTWTGAYVGANGGYGRQDGSLVNLFTNDAVGTSLGDSTTASRGTIGDLDADGWFGGLQAGYNWQAGTLVFGVEADIQGADLNGDRAGRFTNPNGTIAIDGTASLNIDWFGTVRGRLGAAFGKTLIYATGGFAYGEAEYRLDAIEVPPVGDFRTSLKADARTGYVLGGGIEHIFGPNWTIKTEYQYIDLGQAEASAPVVFIATGAPRVPSETATSDMDVDFHTVRIGINYKFPPRPAVAPLK